MRKYSLLLVTVALLLLEWSAVAYINPSSQKKVESICADKQLSTASISILAVTQSGDTLAVVNPEMKQIPASNVKLITTGLALKALGENFRFETTLGYSGKIEKGTLYGNLYIIGGGDPSTGAHKLLADTTDELFLQWMSILRDAGIDKIEGYIVGDPRHFDDFSTENLGWTYEDLGTYYGVGPSGLNFFENAQNFLITPGRTMGTNINVMPVYPQTPWMNYSVQATTGEARSDNTVYYINTPLSPSGAFGGSFPIDRTTHTYEGSNRFGAYTCVWYFYEYLKNAGIAVSGGAADVTSDGWIRYTPGLEISNERALSVGELSILGKTYSSNLASFVLETNHVSDNFFAEALFKQTAKSGTNSSTDAACRREAERLLKSMGLTVAGRYRQVDGSGLSRKNYISAGFFVDFLRAMMKEECFRAYILSLPSPGSRGTLEYKFTKKSPEFRNRIRMKSGSMNGVCCYSGYILPSSSEGETVIFSILTNNYSYSSWSLVSLLDSIIEAVAEEN